MGRKYPYATFGRYTKDGGGSAASMTWRDPLKKSSIDLEWKSLQTSRISSSDVSSASVSSSARVTASG